MHRRLRRDLDPINLPKLPEKKYFNMNPEFLETRLRNLHEYLKSVILIYEALENPILQRFLEIDITYDPNFEYAPIEFSKGRELVPLKKKRRDRRDLRKESDVALSVTNKPDRLEIKKSRRSRKNSAQPSPHLRKKSSRRSGREKSKRRQGGMKRRDSFKRGEKLEIRKEESKRKSETDIEFMPEELEGDEVGYTGVNIPKCRYFDPKLDAPIDENEPGNLCLDGASDPFPLSPEQLKEREEQEKELESLKKKVRSIRVKNDDIVNKSFTTLGQDTTDPITLIQDEYLSFDPSKYPHLSEQEILIKTPIPTHNPPQILLKTPPNPHLRLLNAIQKASIAIAKITRENGENFELRHRVKDMERNLDDCKRFYGNVDQKMRVVERCFKERYHED